MTESQLERLLKRLARIQRQPAYLSAWATPGKVANVGAPIGSFSPILAANKYRWGVTMSALGQPAAFAFGQAPSNTAAGILVTPNQAALTLTYDDIGAVILYPLIAAGQSAGASVSVHEYNVPFPLDGTMPFKV